MKYTQYEVTVRVWLYPGMAGWHFVTVPKDVSEEIRVLFADRKRGWGSLPVTATVGATSWKTSVFPDKTEGAYLLPLKSDVRKKERIAAGDTIRLTLDLRV